MDVVIAGGHGQIALRLARLLSARGERVRSLIRNPDHSADVEAVGAEAVVFDLEQGSSDELASVATGSSKAGNLHAPKFALLQTLRMKMRRLRSTGRPVWSTRKSLKLP